MELKNIFKDVNDAEHKKSKPQLENSLEEIIGKKNIVTFRDDKRSSNDKRNVNRSFKKRNFSSHECQH